MAATAETSEVLQPLPPELHPDVDHLVTEDNAPVDSVFSEKQQRLLTEPLHSSWTGGTERRSFVAMSNVGLFYAVHQAPFVPDAMLSLDVRLPADVRPKPHRSYFIWEYGKAPDVVVEVVSNREGGEDTEKLSGYARIGVPYYVIFDPDRLLSAEALRAYRLEGRQYRRMEGEVSFPDVELGMRLWRGRYEDIEAAWLRWANAEGRLIPSGCERADAERERAERLAEQLRRLGAQPAE